MAFLQSIYTASRRSSSIARKAMSIECLMFNNYTRRPWFSSGGISEGRKIEDLRRFHTKSSAPESLLHCFRKKKALSVTDLIFTDWCEKQMEFRQFDQVKKAKKTDAMKAGRIRHKKLEEEVRKKVRVPRLTYEDMWAERFINFIIDVNHLSVNGLIRELTLLGFVRGVWIVGVIDEIQMPVEGTTRIPSLVEIKTCSKPKLPNEQQRRKGRFQLMCYKHLWDNVVTANFPTNLFFSYFGLNPLHVLSKEIQEPAASLGFSAKNLGDLVMNFRNICCTLPRAHDQLLLRYEFQGDDSFLGEDHFTYESDWINNKIQTSLEFWLGEREANYVPLNERWKCRYCKFAEECPACATPKG